MIALDHWVRGMTGRTVSQTEMRARSAVVGGAGGGGEVVQRLCCERTLASGQEAQQSMCSSWQGAVQPGCPVVAAARGHTLLFRVPPVPVAVSVAVPVPVPVPVPVFVPGESAGLSLHAMVPC